MSVYSPGVVAAVRELLDIGIALSAEKNYKILLERILSESRRITACDAGTLYLVKSGKLSFEIIQNDTLNIHQGGQGEPIELPPVDIAETAAAGFCALHNTVINIPDVYKPEISGIDFTGPRRYDALTGYHTISMMVIPLENHEGAIIGVLQLLNAQDEEGAVIPFAAYLEPVVRAIASQAAVAISNMRYVEEIDNMLQSFVRVISIAIDERSSYNANHTRNMATLTGKFANYIKTQQDKALALELSDKDVEQLIMAAWLHDIGKIAVPLSIMDKPSRLGQRYELVKNRLFAICEQRKVKAIKEMLQQEKPLRTKDSIVDLWDRVAAIQKEMDHINEFVDRVNGPNCFIDDPIREEIREIADRTWLGTSGFEENWLLPEEVEALQVPRGTLTDLERRVMENHVGIAQRMLEQIPFGKKYVKVPEWACAHHEFLDGSGYPQNLHADELPLPVRILTIMDIYDALTAQDRPYKKALPKERAFAIMEEMANAEKLDGELLRLFKQSRIWEEKQYV